MRITLWKDYRITRHEMDRRLPHHLDITFPFGNHMKDHHPLRARLQEWSCVIRMRRLIAPRCRKPSVDEDGPDQAHHPQGF